MTSVRVGVRIRPLTSREESEGGKQVVEALHPTVGIGKRKFTYDAVFDSKVSQQTLYHQVAPPLLKSFLEGYNATIMAYGQTGSGKTFTMGSEAHSENSTVLAQPGLIPRFMQDMFQSLKGKKDASDDQKGPILLDYSVYASFLEVYGEDVHDLTDKDRTTLPLREDSQGGVVVSGLKSQPVSTVEEALTVLHIGTLNRTTAATLMNLTSSRSHAVFTVHLTQTTRGRGDIDVKTISKFTFVDLAGSERMKKTGAEGERMREGIKINEGLLALGNVINALADEGRLLKNEKVHVPYRQSKLTRLLQDALGGNSQTLFLACVSPADVNSSETLSTLHYANRARNIKNEPKMNVDATVLEVQQLHALNHVLMSELVKEKFGRESEKNIDKNENSAVGDLDLMQRKDVKEYIILVQQIAQQRFECGSSSENSPINTFFHLTKVNPLPVYYDESLAPNTPACEKMSTNAMTPKSTYEDSTQHGDGDCGSAAISPDEELAILDQLLELQQRDQDYDQEHRKDQQQLKLFNGALEEHATMLLQLKDSLKVYHTMKEKYEALMTEVRHLETEKISLAHQLENVTADPTKGCSAAIKKKVAKVEASLTRARADARKHQEMYRRAEQQAKKCDALELKISELKMGKVNLIKKQKEAAAKHREYTENKTREISLLKRKQLSDGQAMTKLQSQARMYEKNLEKRTNYCNKLADKLKQTESHLMKLLSMRQQDLQNRMEPKSMKQIGFRSAKLKMLESCVVSADELSTTTLLLERMVAHRIDHAQMRLRYEDRVAEYGTVIRSLRNEVSTLDNLRKEGRETRETEESLEDLELKCELIGSDMEDLRMKLASSTSGDVSDSFNQEEETQNMIRNLAAPLARTLLWDFIDRFANAELENRNLCRVVNRKESALQSLECELEAQCQKVKLCTDELAARRAVAIAANDPFEIIKGLESSLKSSNLKIEDFERAKKISEKQLKNSNILLAVKEHELTEMREKIALSEVLSRQNGGPHSSTQTLKVLQEIWVEVGVSFDKREAIRLQILSCVEDTCTRMLEGAKKMKFSTRTKITRLKNVLTSMQNALGLQIDDESHFHGAGETLLDIVDALKEEVNLLRPRYDSAMERRNVIIHDTTVTMESVAMSANDLSVNLKSLVKSHNAETSEHPTERSTGKQRGCKGRSAIMKEVQSTLAALDNFFIEDGAGDQDQYELCFFPPSSLEAEFLDKCEVELSKLRLAKTEKLAANAHCRQEVGLLMKAMYMFSDDIATLADNCLEKLPDWWQKDVAADIARCIFRSDCIIKATPVFTQHLCEIYTLVVAVAEDRRFLSIQLKDFVDRAQKTLLMTVDGELDASEAYAGFHSALFQLPPLSQDHIEALIAELDALVTGVDAMTQSEIEALTVVWEALSITSSERGKFWGNLEEITKSLKSQNDTSFPALTSRNYLFMEKWLVDSARQAAKVCGHMNVRLLKLEEIHNEVERLRSKQDAKSRILSLDSEILILSSRLDEFEEMKCNKERLLSKKTGSSSLLQEERFRKQMQGKFTAKLEQLASLLKIWNDTEKLKFDSELLSEEVRTLVANPDRMDTAVAKRTEFMHLRTVRTKLGTGTKRSSDNASPDESPVKRQKSNISPKKVQSVRSVRSVEAPTISSRTRGTTRAIDSANNRNLITLKSESPVKTRAMRKGRMDCAKRAPLSPNMVKVNTRYGRTSNASLKNISGKKRDALNPFGNLLPDASSPQSKENISM